MKNIKYTAVLTVIVLSAAFIICACGKSTEHTAVPETTIAIPVSTSVAPESTEAPVPTDTAATVPESSKEEAEEAPGMTGMPNPMKKAESSEDFKTIGLSLELPENKEWYKDSAYYIIDGEIAQISFHDEIVQSEAVARTAKEELGDISGIYYNFNTEKERHFEAVTTGGDKIDIKVQLLVDGADIPGVLASWNYKGSNFTLWEDEGKKDVDSLGKLAVEIAVRSAQ